jgi:hypothetical protein
MIIQEKYSLRLEYAPLPRFPQTKTTKIKKTQADD